MDNKRIIIAGVVFLAILGVAIYAVQKQDERYAGDDPEGAEADEATLPTIDKDAVTELEITRPAEEGQEAVTIRLVKVDDTWRVAAPVEAEADESAVSTALDKLAELEVSGVAATKAANHERLQVSEAKGIRVVVKAGAETVATLYIGAYRGRSTMVRADGSDVVAAVRGSINYAFNKELKDWRNRRIVDEEPNDVIAVRFENANGTFAFHRDGESNWVPDEGQEPIERFGSAKVQSIVSSIARMRATNFADAAIDSGGAGLEAPTGTVTLTVRRAPAEGATEAAEGEAPEAAEGEAPEAPEGEAPTAAEGQAAEATQVTETIVLRVGAAVGSTSELYCRRDGNPTIFVVSQYLGDRMRPNAEQFQESEAGAAGMEPDMAPMPGAGGHGDIPPELMQQIQAQLNMQAG